MDEQKFQRTLIKRQRIPSIIPAWSPKLHFHRVARNAEVLLSIRHHPYFMWYLFIWLAGSGLSNAEKFKWIFLFFLMTNMAHIYLHWPVSSSMIHNADVELKFYSTELRRLTHCLCWCERKMKKNPWDSLYFSTEIKEQQHSLHRHFLVPMIRPQSVFWNAIHKAPSFLAQQQFTLCFDFGKTYIRWVRRDFCETIKLFI